MSDDTKRVTRENCQADLSDAPPETRSKPNLPKTAADIKAALKREVQWFLSTFTLPWLASAVLAAICKTSIELLGLTSITALICLIRAAINFFSESDEL
jgi:hypothetical protein